MLIREKQLAVALRKLFVGSYIIFGILFPYLKLDINSFSESKFKWNK